ncbi:hypothetical protein JM47_02145 [Ureaplasma diversum]|uniref:Aromatic cluster surface protein n=1 Tax=Ureaplasma diversum TaxID=42094 RepID=A0A0C5RC03_9BACT|nr:aromatic motif membrane protein [Ureaplasma diversum]AJQ45381.1 hypothetical protein JM47_02145 [Ureaplasma diversum]
MKSKFLKTSLMLLPLLSIAPISLAISCTQTKSETQSKIVVDNQQIKQNQWDLFLANQHIKSLLNLVFENEADKLAYIKQQQNIDSKAYQEKIAFWLNYFSVLLPTWDGLFRDSIPLAYSTADQLYTEIFEKNWLWFLFNLDQMVFMIQPKHELFQETSEESLERIRSESIDNGIFFKPKSNIFLDASITYGDNGIVDEKNDLFNIFLLHKDGFIFQFEVEKFYTDNTKKTLTKKRTRLFSFVHTYPLLQQHPEQLLNNFNIRKYTEVSQFIRSDNPAVSSTAQLIFNDEYGGNFITYKFADLNK